MCVRVCAYVCVSVYVDVFVCVCVCVCVFAQIAGVHAHASYRLIQAGSSLVPAKEAVFLLLGVLGSPFTSRPFSLHLLARAQGA
mmetsp:Transcript_16360/g.22942  ORF Transcript_16360/g.22942 Transcript_16360/m.22942 type:complete len:84 (+) Transcript_16360:44-295(+)